MSCDYVFGFYHELNYYPKDAEDEYGEVEFEKAGSVEIDGVKFVRERTCKFTLEYDRDEVERRRKMYEENPLGLFPQDMPETAWTCSSCGQQFKSHYDRQTGRLLPIPEWMKHCPQCGAKVVER